MWSSTKLLVVGVFRHWYQALGGAGMAIVALLSEIWNWPVPPRIWVSLSALLFLWAILRTFHELRLTATPGTDALVGKWFHTITDEGNIQFQGKVLQRQDERYFIQLYSFLDGEPSTKRFLTSREVDTARFYDSNAEMQDEYYRLNPELRRS